MQGMCFFSPSYKDKFFESNHFVVLVILELNAHPNQNFQVLAKYFQATPYHQDIFAIILPKNKDK